MGLFDLFKKKEKPADKATEQTTEQPASSTLLAMPMFNNGETFNADALLQHLQSEWRVNVSDVHRTNNETLAFSIEGETIALATMPIPIPASDIQGTARYAYNWTTAEKDIQDHNSHILVTLMSGKKSHLERYTIFTKALASILATTNALGVYQGSQSLLIPKEQYLEGAQALQENKIPVSLWLYIGLRKGDQGNNVYTYGLSGFGKMEMEIINSSLGLEELYDFIGNICSYVIKSNVTFKSGETLGYTAEQKIRITQSKGVFVEGDSLKLEM